VKLRVGKRAQQQADKLEAWWVEHRPAAASLFLDELEETLSFFELDLRGSISRIDRDRDPGPHPPPT